MYNIYIYVCNREFIQKTDRVCVKCYSENTRRLIYLIYEVYRENQWSRAK